MDEILAVVYGIMLLFIMYIIFLGVTKDKEHRHPKEWVKDNAHEAKKNVKESAKDTKRKINS